MPGAFISYSVLLMSCERSGAVEVVQFFGIGGFVISWGGFLPGSRPTVGVSELLSIDGALRVIYKAGLLVNDSNFWDIGQDFNANAKRRGRGLLQLKMLDLKLFILEISKPRGSDGIFQQDWDQSWGNSQGRAD